MTLEFVPFDFPEIGEVSASSQKLEALLKRVSQGELGLPGFQRGDRFGNPEMCWSPVQRRKLMASVLCGYPIGSLTIVKYAALKKSEKGDIKLRAIAGANNAIQHDADLLLDGQQRLSTLAQHLRKPNRGPAIKGRDPRLFAFNWKDFLKRNLNGAIFKTHTSPADQIYPLIRLVDRNKMDPGSAFAKFLPLWVLLLSDKSWDAAIVDILKIHPGVKGEQFKSLLETLRSRLRKYEVPVSEIKSASTEGGDLDYRTVCDQFIKLNISGKKLLTQDLVNARLAMEQEQKHLMEIIKSVFADGIGKDVFNSISVLPKLALLLIAGTPNDPGQAQRQLEGLDADSIPNGNQESLLKASQQVYKRGAERIKNVINFFEDILQKDMWSKVQSMPAECFLPLVGVFALRNYVGQPSNNAASRRKVRVIIWTWMLNYKPGSSHGGYWRKRFLEAAKLLAMTDNEFNSWSFEQTKQAFPETFQYQSTGGGQAVETLLRRQQYGLPDFISGNVATIANDLHVHHIFPKDWCARHAPQLKNISNSWANLTLISPSTNIKISNKAPSTYLQEIIFPSVGNNRDQCKSMLGKHGIEIEHLEADDFENFYKARTLWLRRQFNDFFVNDLSLSVPFPTLQSANPL